MGFLDAYEGTERIDLGNGYWIDVKACLSMTEYRRVQAYFGARRQSVSMSDQKTFIDPAAAQEELLFLSVADWNLDDENGKWPLEPEQAKRASIRRLPSAVFMQVYQVCDKLNGPRKGSEAAQFPGEAVGGGPDGDAGAGGPGPVPDGAGVLDAAWDAPRSLP